ncbi:MAG TPA: CvpA family protein [Chitinophagaceae bacterium]|nr:CvpA family protein [Chitinophagaceae bacterium]
MLLDLVFAVILILAVLQGYQKGLVVGLFSFLAIIIGLAAAIKLSTVMAELIGKSINISQQWLPLISFAVIFLLVILLIRWVAKLIEKSVEIAMLGWVNKLGGIIFYTAIYTIIFSVVLFYLEQMKIIQLETIQKSVTYSFVQPWGPKAINGFGAVIPVFKDLFGELEKFFEKIAQQITSGGQ